MRERERFLAHLEATGTRRSAIRIAATYLLQVFSILGLRRLRDVTLEEVDPAADHWNTLRNQDKQYPAGQFGVKCLAQAARRFLRFEGKLKYPRLPQPFSKYLEEFVEATSSERGSRERPFAGGDIEPPTSLNGTRGDIEAFAGFDYRHVDLCSSLAALLRVFGTSPHKSHWQSSLSDKRAPPIAAPDPRRTESREDRVSRDAALPCYLAAKAKDSRRHHQILAWARKGIRDGYLFQAGR